MTSALLPGIRGDRVVRRDQRPQHVDELRRRFVPERDDLGDQPVAAGADRPHAPPRRPAAWRRPPGTIFTTPSPSTAAKPCSRSAESSVGIDEALRHRPGRDDVDRALDPGVDHEIAAGDLGDRLDDRLDVGVDEIERDRLVGAPARPRAKPAAKTRKRATTSARRPRRAARVGRSGCTGLRSFVVKRAPGRTIVTAPEGAARENCTNRRAARNFAAAARFRE